GDATVHDDCGRGPRRPRGDRQGARGRGQVRDRLKRPATRPMGFPRRSRTSLVRGRLSVSGDTTMADDDERSCAGMRDNVIRLVFEGDARRFEEFCDVLRRAIPPDTAAVLRGSSVTGFRWEDGAPFDVDGPGTSDLDLTIVGSSFLDHY